MIIGHGFLLEAPALFKNVTLREFYGSSLVRMVQIRITSIQTFLIRTIVILESDAMDPRQAGFCNDLPKLSISPIIPAETFYPRYPFHQMN